MSKWSPEQYERFKRERAQPFHDLLALIEPRPHMHIADLGCGTGELTRQLHEKLGAAETIGVDNSPAMLSKARSLESSSLRFAQTDIAEFAPARPLDLIFSNAALHWVSDHADLLAKVAGFLEPHGQLAIQMPANDDHPSHAIAADIASEMGIAPRANHLLTPQAYASLLHYLGFKRQHVRLQVYGHELPSSRDVIEWNRGALLTDYEARLGEQFGEFLSRYSARVAAELGDDTPFFYTYKRLLIWAAF